MTSRQPRDRVSLRLLVVAALLFIQACEPSGPPAEPPSGPPADEPPSTLEVAPKWERRGFGEVAALSAADLDGDGEDEVVMGGRGVSVIDAASRSGGPPRWSFTWRAEQQDPWAGGDNDGAYDARVVDTAQGPAVLVLGDRMEAFLLDGETGAVRWSAPLATDMLPTHMALVDVDGAAAFFPAGGREAYAVESGDVLWTADAMALGAVRVVAAELDGAAGADVVTVQEEDGMIGFSDPPLTEEGSGTEVFAYGGDGALLWSHALGSGQVTALAAAQLSGGDTQAVLVGHGESVVALGPDGALWQVEVQGFVAALAAADLEGTGIDTVFVAVDHENSTEVVALTAAGARAWSWPLEGWTTLLVVDDVEEDGHPELLVGTGREHWGGFGQLLALDPAAELEQRVRWSLETARAPRAAAVARQGGARTLLVGGQDAIVRAVDPATGQARWTHDAGRYVFATAAGLLDGEPVVAWGDDAGQLFVAGAEDGLLRFTRRLDAGADGQVTAVAVADVEGDGAGDVVVTAVRYFSGEPGLVARYRADGSEVFSRRLSAEAWDVRVVDLDGDGAVEIVVADVEAPDLGGGSCGVRALDATGQLVWRRAVNVCLQPWIDVGVLDGEERPVVAYGDLTLATTPRVGLVDADGALRWSDELSQEDTRWVRLAPGGVVNGGRTLDGKGHTTLRSPDGAVLWRASLEASPWAGEDVAPESGSVAGALVPLEGGGLAVATSTEAADVVLLDARTGAPRWKRRLQEPATLPDYRLWAGPLAFVPASDGVLPSLAVGMTSSNRVRAQLVAVDLEGDVVARRDTGGEARAIDVVTYADGRRGAVFGAGLSVHALEALPSAAR